MNESKVYMKCKCFKSLKKNEDPHQLTVSIYIYFFLFMKTEVAIRKEVLFSTFCSCGSFRSHSDLRLVR